MASEKEIKSYGEQFVRSSAPLQNPNNIATGTYVVNSLPTMRYYADNYDQDYSVAFRAIYKIGRGMIEAHRQVTKENEIIKLNNEYVELRSDFSKKWDNPEEINIASEKWREDRKKAFEDLQQKESELLSNSKLNDRDIDIFATRNSKFYKDSEVEFDFRIGEFERKKNISTYATNIENSIMLISSAKNKAEQEQYIASINASKAGLMKYDVLETDIDKNILDGFENLVRKNNITNLNKIFRGATVDNYQDAAKQAQGYVTTNFTSAMGLLGGIDGFKDRDAGKIAQTLLQTSMEEAKDFIADKQSAFEYKRQIMAEREANKAERMRAKGEENLKKQQNFYNRDADLVASGDVPKLIAHRLGYAGEIDILDIAYNESIEQPLDYKVYGENFTLEKQGEDNNYYIGSFINDGYFTGAGGIKETIADLKQQGLQEADILKFVEATAKDMLGNTGDYEVSEEKKEKVLKGAVKEILFKSGYDPKIMDGNVNANLKAIEYFKNSKKYEATGTLMNYNANELSEGREFFKPTKFTPLEDAIDKTKKAIAKDNGRLADDLVEKRARELVLGRIIELGNKTGVDFKTFETADEEDKIEIYNSILEKDTLFDDEAELKKVADGMFNMYMDGDRYKRKKVIPFKDVK